MEQVVRQFGLDWKLLLSQGVNFGILLIILTRFAYRPLLRVMEERRVKIEDGLQAAEESERRLSEIDRLQSQKMAEADREAVSRIARAEEEAHARGITLVKEAEEQAQALLETERAIFEQKKQDEFNRMVEGAERFVREAIVKTVEMSPETIDAKLIKKAVEAMKGKVV